MHIFFPSDSMTGGCIGQLTLCFLVVFLISIEIVERISLSLSVFKCLNGYLSFSAFLLMICWILSRRKRSIHRSLKVGLLRLFKICMMFCDLMFFALIWGTSDDLSFLGLLYSLNAEHNYYHIVLENTLRHGTFYQRQGMKAGCSQN